jgi:hypothetical protein
MIGSRCGTRTVAGAVGCRSCWRRFGSSATKPRQHRDSRSYAGEVKPRERAEPRQQELQPSGTRVDGTTGRVVTVFAQFRDLRPVRIAECRVAGRLIGKWPLQPVPKDAPIIGATAIFTRPRKAEGQKKQLVTVSEVGAKLSAVRGPTPQQSVGCEVWRGRALKEVKGQVVRLCVARCNRCALAGDPSPLAGWVIARAGWSWSCRRGGEGCGPLARTCSGPAGRRRRCQPRCPGARVDL